MECTKGRQETVQLQAGWATRSWSESVGNILVELVDDECLRRVGLLGRPEGEEGRKSQRDAASKFVQLIVTSAAQRAWSMSIWSETPPLNLCGILSEDPAQARSALSKMKDDADVVTKLLQVNADTTEKETMQA